MLCYAHLDGWHGTNGTNRFSILFPFRFIMQILLHISGLHHVRRYSSAVHYACDIENMDIYDNIENGTK